MIRHTEVNDPDLRRKLRQKEVCFAGNSKLKIYGTLKCKSGKRMKKENRVFFSSQEAAVKHGFRPCGHCMKTEYKSYLMAIR